MKYGQTALAAVSGAIIGFVLTLWLGWSQLWSLTTGTLVGGISGFVLYDPVEACRVFVRVSKELASTRISLDFLRKPILTRPDLAHAWQWSKRAFEVTARIVMLWTFPISAMLVIPFLAWGTLPYLGYVYDEMVTTLLVMCSFYALVCFFMIANAPFIDEKRSISRVTPLAWCLTSFIGMRKDQVSSDGMKKQGWLRGEDGKLFGWKSFLSLLDEALWLIATPVIGILLLLLLLVDCLLMTFMALANTKRLAAMSGGATGFIAGWAAYTFLGFTLATSIGLLVVTAIIFSVVPLYLRQLLESASFQEQVAQVVG